MKKIISFLFFICLCLLPNIVSAEEVNLYLFHSKDCSHCKQERLWLETIKDEYEYLNIYEYEVTRNQENSDLLDKVKERFMTDTPYVPFTVVGDKYWVGFGENAKSGIIEIVEKYNTQEHRDIVYEVINNIDNSTIEDGDKIDDTFVIPILGEINAKNVSLPILSIIVGFVDGFNPCAMWVLIFLISMLMGMKNKKRMWTLGLTFLVASALVYLVFMFAWLNVAVSLVQINWIRILVAVIALIGAFVNLKNWYKAIKTKDDGCEVVDSKRRKKIMNHIKKFTSEKSFWLAIIGVIGLAFAVNLIELACSAGLPLIFTQVLALNNLTILQSIIYVTLYILFFLLDDIVVFTIAMKTLELTGISTKYTKYSHLIGGIIMLLIGVLMIVKPSWLMFNF